MEMGIENKKLRATFIKRLDNNEKARMFLWRYVDYKTFQKAFFDFTLN